MDRLFELISPILSFLVIGAFNNLIAYAISESDFEKYNGKEV